MEVIRIKMTGLPPAPVSVADSLLAGGVSFGDDFDALYARARGGSPQPYGVVVSDVERS
jgi:hypothetical protein